MLLIDDVEFEPAYSSAYWIKITKPRQPPAYQCSRCKKLVNEPKDRCEGCGSEMEVRPDMV